MRHLAVAESLDAIDDTFRQMFTDPRPGFQISPDVPFEDALDRLQAHMRRELGLTGFTFNVAFGTTEPVGIAGIQHFYEKVTKNDSGPHIDEPESRRDLGIVMHHNIEGIGSVILQLARYGVTDLDTAAYGRMFDRRQTAGRRFEGRLVPGMKTIFSEGLVAMTGLKVVRLGPSIHDFKSDSKDRKWTRFGWEPTVRA